MADHFHVVPVSFLRRVIDAAAYQGVDIPLTDDSLHF